jgi:hypothetical protein
MAASDAAIVQALADALGFPLVDFRDAANAPRFDEHAGDFAGPDAVSVVAQRADAQVVDQVIPHAAQSAGLAGRDA